MGLFLFLFVASGVNTLHLYAGTQQTYLVSQSANLKSMYTCKDDCFKLNATFPYPMKYIRTVYVKALTDQMYFQGHCYLQVGTPPAWVVWGQFNQTSGVSDTTRPIWEEYNSRCENKIGEICEESRKALGLTSVHSQYIFYSDGRFENTQQTKNGDLNNLLNILTTNIPH